MNIENHSSGTDLLPSAQTSFIFLEILIHAPMPSLILQALVSGTLKMGLVLQNTVFTAYRQDGWCWVILGVKLRQLAPARENAAAGAQHCIGYSQSEQSRP